jgi:protein-S-isoprenylcysteine O-methyltransferase Ste14
MTGSSMMKNAIFAVTLLLSLALAGLAVMRWRENGWGALVWLIAFVAMFLIRAPYGAGSRANRIVNAEKGTGEKLLLVSMFATMMVLPLLHLSTGLFAFADYKLDESASAAGTLLQIPFLFLFWRSHADLGRNWSPGLEVREKHELVTRGVYARIRHPMYAAIWLSALAQPLLLHNWIAGFLVLPAFAAMWFIRVPREEAMMREAFGAAYDDYCSNTGRLLPKAGGCCQ